MIYLYIMVYIYTISGNKHKEAPHTSHLHMWCLVHQVAHQYIYIYIHAEVLSYPCCKLWYTNETFYYDSSGYPLISIIIIKWNLSPT